jgi:hypothetical protein
MGGSYMEIEVGKDYIGKEGVHLAHAMGDAYDPALRGAKKG